MANYATNLFFASTENEEDLDKIGQFLDENFDSVYERDDDSIEGEFFFRVDLSQRTNGRIDSHVRG